MGLRLNGSTSGYTEVNAPASAGNNTLVLPTGNGSAGNILGTDGSGNLSWVNGRLVLGTAQNSTSGTSIDFTGIPNWVKRVTVMFNGVSTNGTSLYQVRLGSSGGIESTGYDSASSSGDNAASYVANSTTGFLPLPPFYAVAANLAHGAFTITNITGNTWIAFGNFAIVGGSSAAACAGTKTLTGALTQVRITTVNGTDTFDAGSINIMYEG